MDQLFINERELPPTPSASAQLLDYTRNPEGLSVRQGKSTEVSPASARGEEDLLWLGNEHTSSGRSRQEHSRSAEHIASQQGTSSQTLPVSMNEGETLQLWLGNEYARESQRLEQEERARTDGQEPPVYTEAEIQSRGAGASQQAASSGIDSLERLYQSHPPLGITNERSPGTLDIYDNNSDTGISREASPSIDNSVGTSDMGNRSVVPRRYSRPSRPYSGYPGNDNQESSTPNENARRSSGSLPSQIFRGPLSQTEAVVPRWQPDAEVTFCPICRTQFSFFVRKHHCRKCGRVVCNACSPHRITIPHQYIVQPPEDPAVSALVGRPADPARARSSTLVPNLGGGERVRLCNPCVPDPNIAPPQTRSDGQPIQSPGHSRSASTVPYPLSRRGDLDIPNYRQPQRDSNLSAEARHNRNLIWTASSEAQPQQASSSYSHRDESLPRPELEARSRSSTLGSARDRNNSNTNPLRQDPSGLYSRPYPPTGPRTEINLSRPLPDTPPTHQRLMRRPIREDDQCWVCFRELPSRELPNFQDLRDAHVRNCLENATRRSSPAANNTSRTLPTGHPATRQPPSFPHPNLDSRQAPTPATTPSTPESRMQARERQHAAIVYGQQSSTSGSSSSASPMSRVIPYIASEKDGIDDAECMVCLEDFEVGQEMGRLECFCRFHLTCIKGWFEKKPGKCPVHGVDN